MTVLLCYNMPMKNTISTLLPLFILTSCGIPESERVDLAMRFAAPAQSNDYASKAMNEYAVEISLTHLSLLVAGKEDFLLYIGQDEVTCSACAISGPAMREYIARTKTLVYYLDLSEYSDAQIFASDYADQYSFLGTPTLLFFNDGKIAYDHVGAARLDTYYKISNLIAGYTKKVPINYVFTTDNNADLIKNGHHVLFLDYQVLEAVTLFQTIKPTITDYDNFYLVDWLLIESEAQSQLSQTYDVDLSYGASLIYWNNDNQQTTLNLNNENSADFSTLFNQ